jgi:hypothetical protein
MESSGYSLLNSCDDRASIFRQPKRHKTPCRVHSAEDLRVRIVNGGTNMPAYGGILKKEELTSIIAFLHSRK